LDLYRKNNDLSEKTKNEALGHITIYTRDDIERMQAYKLSDLLQSLRLFRYDENMFGMTDVFHEDPIPYLSSMVKIYINDHEITSAFTGNGLFVYGNIDLGFVDHVEIYEGTSSTYVNTDPSLATIKLYSKDPSREDGSHIQAYVGSRGTNHQNISFATDTKDLKYYLYASRTDANREKYEHKDHTLSRDYEDLHALFTLKYKNIDLDAEILKHRKDAFLSYSMFATPQDSDMEYLMGRISTKISFLDDDSLKLFLSVVRFDESTDLNMDGTRWSSDIDDFKLVDDNLTSSSLDDTYDIKLEKTLTYNMHHLITGTQFRFKHFHDVEVYNRGIKDTDPEFAEHKILSFYLQDDYMFNEQHLLSISGKINHYHSKSNRNDDIFNTYQARAGYIYSSKNDSFKTFLSFMQIPTEQYSLTISKSNNIEILDMIDLTSEYIKTIGSHQVSLTAQFVQNDNMNGLLSTNNSDKSDSYSASIKYNYNFDEFNNLKSMLYMNEFPSLITNDIRKSVGGFIQLFNHYNRWDIFNEAVYYELIDTPAHGLTYNASLRYHISRDFIVSLKGSNIFNSAAKSEYNYLSINGFIPSLQSLYYSPIDQLISVGLEYSF
jgi:iron complex outermembrane receptor protein